MGKYDPLKTFLLASGADEVPLSFDEIEALLGAPLPASRCYPAWWSNNPSNNTMTRVWLEAGYRTEQVDIARRKVVFRRAPEAASASPQQSRTVGEVIERLQRALKGTVTIPPGTDLTAPIDEEWDAQTS